MSSKYICEPCKYETKRECNLERHQKSNLHLKRVGKPFNKKNFKPKDKEKINIKTENKEQKYEIWEIGDDCEIVHLDVDINPNINRDEYLIKIDNLIMNYLRHQINLNNYFNFNVYKNNLNQLSNLQLIDFYEELKYYEKLIPTENEED